MRHTERGHELEESITQALSSHITECHIQKEIEDSKINQGQYAEIVSRLGAVFSTKDSYRSFLKYRRSKDMTQRLLDLFQRLLDTPGLETTFRYRLLDATQRLSRTTDVYPARFKLQGVKLTDCYPYANGGFADVYRGTHEGRVVCLKAIRLSKPSQVKYFYKRLCPEAILLGQLKHQNVLPLYGICELGQQLSLVSPWAEHGDINSYLELNPGANRARLSQDVAYGVAYLHDNNIIHGDLKGANILVDGSGRALVADFGLSAVMDPQIIRWTSQSSLMKGGTTRWQAPELFGRGNDGVVNNSKHSDIYALACVLYEIFTGRIPFFEDPRNVTVMYRVSIEGKQPSRPLPSSSPWSAWGLTEPIWELMTCCWSEDPMARPTIEQYITRLNQEVTGVDDRPSSPELNPHSQRDVGQHLGYPTIKELETLLWGEAVRTPILG
ncbi:kinase-like domain-containing protein [Collybia nuda]|uniref:Kinase-like domain-containing protein n=1 Tax=Collybia nuda TaxID=64659 RepID=A0A9P5Y9U1_9AGAR|nr:kinase-like domain-containing protein [Collybia nuda]